jgi:hypothetical protein
LPQFPPEPNLGSTKRDKKGGGSYDLQRRKNKAELPPELEKEKRPKYSNAMAFTQKIQEARASP